MGQMLLLPDPRPLDERLGKKFFRQAPQGAGVYLMKDAQDKVLYVGKAKNLQQRLRHYRIANPDRMPRRHLKLVRQVTRIDFQFCPGESAALKHESKLIRSLKPQFNRAGVWPGKTRFIVWRQAEEQLELGLMEVPAAGWQRFGPLGGNASGLQHTLARLLWMVVNPGRQLVELPVGWMKCRMPEKVSFDCGSSGQSVMEALDGFFWRSGDKFVLWLGSNFTTRTHPFERNLIEKDLETLKEFAARHEKKDKLQPALL